MSQIGQSPEIEKAYQLAKESRLRAHAPYSKYLVGACFKLVAKDQYFTGCNVENASYGGTVCAERVALFASIAQLGKPEVEFMVIVTQDSPPAPPCGFCLQVMAEFLKPKTKIYLANLEGIERVLHFEELLPMPFCL